MARSSGGEEEIILHFKGGKGDKKYLKKAKIDANKEYDKHGHWWWNKGKD